MQRVWLFTTMTPNKKRQLSPFKTEDPGCLSSLRGWPIVVAHSVPWSLRMLWGPRDGRMRGELAAGGRRAASVGQNKRGRHRQMAGNQEPPWPASPPTKGESGRVLLDSCVTPVGRLLYGDGARTSSHTFSIGRSVVWMVTVHQTKEAGYIVSRSQDGEAGLDSQGPALCKWSVCFHGYGLAE